VAVGVAFMVFGLIVDRELTAEWVGQRPNVLLDVSISGREVIVSEALVRVAAILGGFAALYFVAVALGDKRNREQFLDDELDRMGRVMAAWSYYRGALAARVTPRRAPGAPA
jgi:NhaP-type Na+/H+ or K+/H+ antiporter